MGGDSFTDIVLFLYLLGWTFKQLPPLALENCFCVRRTFCSNESKLVNYCYMPPSISTKKKVLLPFHLQSR